MKANELMIGDWVLAKGKPFRVDEVHADGTSPIWVCTEVYGYDYVWDDIEPIPLSPEILEKNGIKLLFTYARPYRDGEWDEGELEEAMKHYPMHVYQTLNPYITFVIRPDEQELKVCSSNNKTRVEKKEKVIFVHELQQAIRYCGINKDIVL